MAEHIYAQYETDFFQRTTYTHRSGDQTHLSHDETHRSSDRTHRRAEVGVCAVGLVVNLRRNPPQRQG